MRMFGFLSSLLLASSVSLAGGATVGGSFKGEFNFDDQKGNAYNSAKVDSTMNYNAWLYPTVKYNHGPLSFETELVLLHSGNFSGNDEQTCLPDRNGIIPQTLVRTASLALDVGNGLSVSGGCQRSLHGGYAHATMHNARNTHGLTPTAINSFIGNFNKSFQLNYGHAKFGTLSVQLRGDDNTSNVHQDKQTFTPSFQWQGNFSGFEPLVQFGMWDKNKSNYWSVSLKNENLAESGLAIGFDYAMYSQKLASETNAHTLYHVGLHYENKKALGEFVPWLYYGAYDNKQGGTDAKANTYTVAVAADPTATPPVSAVAATDFSKNTSFTDNSQTISFGVDMKHRDNFMHYLAVDMTSGDFQSSTGKKEKLSDMRVRIGATASF